MLFRSGFDYAHESGFYIGNWNSSISWIGDSYPANTGGRTSAPSAPIEMDFYAGFKKELIGAGFASDIGVLQYYYPMANAPANACGGTGANAGARNVCGANPNTTELYVAQNFTFGPLTGFAKVSYSLSNIFGINNSSGHNRLCHRRSNRTGTPIYSQPNIIGCTIARLDFEDTAAETET